MNPSLISALAVAGGNWVIYGLILCSVAALAVILERWKVLSREEKLFAALQSEVLARRKDAEGVRSALKVGGAAGRILGAALDDASDNPEVFEDILISASLKEKKFLEKRLLVLGTLGNNAPFIGLFGTVLGVIKAFHDLAANAAGPDAVMAGLSTALVATAVGLFVAIPSVVAYNYFQKKASDLLSGTESLGRLLLARLRRAPAARRAA
ncbi:MAG: MotA/TolQ/ExbB proton channel family protein [Elusimicrobia bacterium]|nr:MotA/TolQ/ExbB proton channel family protein [Elusimicrobiota bacterium]MDE2314255.1 MotA/TolQ/ExbB proton channel family protein [Elusimicrobiota bacterium]